MERAMYNGSLAAVSLYGDKFFYVNPLESRGDHHRVNWFDTSCCPTQIARFIPSIGNYIYAKTDRAIIVNLYVEGKATLSLSDGLVVVTQFTNYPWEGTVDIVVETTISNPLPLLLRYPGWSKSAKVQLNGKAFKYKLVNGYIKITKNRKAEIELPL